MFGIYWHHLDFSHCLVTKAGTLWLQEHSTYLKGNFLLLLSKKKLDAEQELIRLCGTEPTELKDLPMRIPKDTPRYHFFLYKHSHEGDYLESTGK